MEKLKNVAVIGALGKMGRGISLLILLEQAWQSIRQKDPTTLHLIDSDLTEARKMRTYLRAELQRSAEKRIVELREAFKDTPLVSNEEMIKEFIEYAINGVEISSEVAAAKNAALVFEAVLEDVDTKVRLFKYLKEHCPATTWFFTNTSSIPLHILNEKAALDGRIIGFHFYNPPMVQKLMEIIPVKGGDPKLKEEALLLAKKLKKTVVEAHDVAGFIGNGYLMREIRLAFDLVHKLKAKEGEEKAMAILNVVTREWLLRPMGIFQLIDYIGLDVCFNIACCMNEYGTEKFHFPLLEKGLQHHLTGGSTLEGNPKNGFFRYERQEPIEIYSFEKSQYVPLPDTSFIGVRSYKGSWKTLHKFPQNEEIHAYFEALFHEECIGASLSKYWLEKGVDFMHDLVQTGVADDIQKVRDVLKLGFYHLYTPNEVLDAYATLS